MCRQKYLSGGRCADTVCIRPATLIVYLPGVGWVRTCERHVGRFPVDAHRQVLGVDVDWEFAERLCGGQKEQSHGRATSARRRLLKGSVKP